MPDYYFEFEVKQIYICNTYINNIHTYIYILSIKFKLLYELYVDVWAWIEICIAGSMQYDHEFVREYKSLFSHVEGVVRVIPVSCALMKKHKIRLSFTYHLAIHIDISIFCSYYNFNLLFIFILISLWNLKLVILEQEV